MTTASQITDTNQELLVNLIGEYKSATYLLSHGRGRGLTVRDWKHLERIREASLYEIAVLLELPDLPPPGEQLSKEHWRQCIDFILQRD